MKSRYTKGFFCSLFVCFSLIKGNVLATNLPEEVMLVRQKFVDTVDHVVLPDARPGPASGRPVFSVRPSRRRIGNSGRAKNRPVRIKKPRGPLGKV